jgi:ApbE superfamily uncharacterized protein (UPF0280 family)
VAPSAGWQTQQNSICNNVLKEDDIPHALELSKMIQGLKGMIIIKDEKIGLWGKIEICHIDKF